MVQWVENVTALAQVAVKARVQSPAGGTSIMGVAIKKKKKRMYIYYDWITLLHNRN